jgi:hypothetical protein
MFETQNADSSQAYVDSSGSGINDRIFYADCSPDQARDRTKRAEEVANILNECRSFGTQCTREIIRSIFQAEVDASRNEAESAAKMRSLISLVNLRLDKGLGLGPEGLPVKNTLYFVIEGISFTQKLSLELKHNYNKESDISLN